MKPDGCGGWKRDYSGTHPRDLREQTGNGLEWCNRKIREHELLDDIDDAQDFSDLKRAVLHLAQLVTGAA